MPDGLVIRDAEADDHGAWLVLWQAYLAFSHTTLRAQVTENAWRGIVEANPRYRCRLAEVQGAVQGFAIHHPHVSTWSINPDCYLEDLFVAEAARGRGLGRALIDDLVRIARAAGWERLYWMTEARNTSARLLYDSYCKTDGNIRYRFRI